MDRLDPLRDRLDGAECGVCGAAIPVAAMRLLADREDLAFVETHCPGCGSVALEMVTATPPPGASEVADPPLPPIGLRDVRTMRAFLAGYRGDLRSLLESGDGPAGRPG